MTYQEKIQQLHKALSHKITSAKNERDQLYEGLQKDIDGENVASFIEWHSQKIAKLERLVYLWEHLQQNMENYLRFRSEKMEEEGYTVGDEDVACILDEFLKKHINDRTDELLRGRAKNHGGTEIVKSGEDDALRELIKETKYLRNILDW